VPIAADQLRAGDRARRELSARGKKAILWDYDKSFFSLPMLAAGGGYIFGRDAQGNLDVHDIGVNTPGAVAGAHAAATW
jgi:maltose/maltodextrin transport system substrate-binding protein